MWYMTFIKEYICNQRFVHDFRDFIYFVIGTERYDNIDYILRHTSMASLAALALAMRRI